MPTSLKLIWLKNGFLKSPGLNIDTEPCMTAMIGGTKSGSSCLKNKTSTESDHVQNSPVVLVLFTVLMMIPN